MFYFLLQKINLCLSIWAFWGCLHQLTCLWRKGFRECGWSQPGKIYCRIFFLNILRVPCVCLQWFSCHQFNTCTGKRSSDAVKKICVKLECYILVDASCELTNKWLTQESICSHLVLTQLATQWVSMRGKRPAVLETPGLTRLCCPWALQRLKKKPWAQPSRQR